MKRLAGDGGGLTLKKVNDATRQERGTVANLAVRKLGQFLEEVE
jgi:hypothetical protein